MQLGTRWSVGGAAPAALPAPVVGAVAQVERELAEQGVDATTWRWTLTYLEHRPVVELDDGTTIRVDAVTGEARIHEADDEGTDPDA
ncbi:hypothetical protein IFT72_07370 [Frigoribacterium sp. CFBP 8754]|uniref:hypothetical protein n=1 Tax=unclassified Frigoribacterium TaxID=2627005 RepID=UPI00177D3D5E|nr:MULTISPECIES: hypothetical protein [unclassified Frigoribacterium]MBD8660012.1 hypothetical protein [Frigoribacterium sp. CFBP 8754]MBD8726357.1 hypothetical protein [Frigoribacterium sp. CFBP 13707]